MQNDQRNFKHFETRWGSEWHIDLGAGHTRLVRDVFKAAFREVQEFPDLESARAASGLKALFEPRIEQYSFATARETGGRYYAVTVRYRINMYTPAAELADTFTLTGYGNALAKGMSSGKPLELASIGAMRDAAAKFLVQFPGQPAGQRLARNEAVDRRTESADCSVGSRLDRGGADRRRRVATAPRPTPRLRTLRRHRPEIPGPFRCPRLDASASDRHATPTDTPPQAPPDSTPSL